MLIKRKELLAVLDHVKPGTGGALSEGMAYFFFTGEEVVSYNNVISISHPFKTDFTTFVKADSFHKLINRITIDDITMEVINDKLRTKAKQVNSNLATIHDQDVSDRITNVSNSLKKIKWRKLPTGFIEGAMLCSFIASTNEAQQTLTCIKIEDNTIASSDNIRLSHYTMKSKMMPMLIKASEVKALASTFPTHYGKGGSWLHFKNADECIFSIRQVKGKFPDFTAFLDFEGDKIELPSAITEGLDITSIIMDTAMPYIKISLKSGACYITASSDEGSIKHRSKINYKGKDLIFSINPDFLKEMMKHSAEITISDTMARIEAGSFIMITSLAD